jgi:putative redox protein
MSVKMQGTYIGGKKVRLIHQDSGAEIITVAPKDNNGDGSSFSPTDLFTSSLGACMLTIIAIIAERSNQSIEGCFFDIEKIMSSESPRKVSEIVLNMHLPKSADEITREKYRRAAMTCPVHHSMSPEINLKLEFIFDI